MNCYRKDTCINYNIRCDSCRAMSDICNYYPLYKNIDEVVVVRCKDCKYFEIEKDDVLGVCKCGYMAVSYGGELYPKENDFCSYGERRSFHE